MHPGTPHLSLGLALAAVLLGGAALAVALDGASASTAPAPPSDVPRLAALERAVERLEAGMGRPGAPALRGTPPRPPERASAPPGPPAPGAEPPAPGRPPGPRPAPPSEERLAEVAALGRKVVADDADEAEQARFWRLAREPGLLDALVAAAEARAAEAPRDVDAHMDLADAYVARLLGTPGGPEQGLWGAKAERAWQAVIEIDPEHWQARYDLALSWSYYPDMMNRTGDAIRAFERLREQQERGPPEARHADVYLHLYQLHLRRGERERAQAVLQAGLARHPDDAALVEAAR